MFRITNGFSFLCFSMLWLSLHAHYRERDNIEIRGAVREEYGPDSRFRQMERSQQGRIRYGKLEERETLVGTTWFFGSGNDSFSEATRMIRSDIEPWKDFRMRSGDVGSSGLTSRLDAKSRMRSRDFQEVSFRDERSSKRRANEERQTDRLRMSEFSFRRSQERRTFEPQRMQSRSRDSNRVRERTDSREVDSLSRARVRDRRIMPGLRRSSVERSTLGTVSGFLELCYSKIKENLTTVLLSIIFLLDFVNEIVRGKKKATSVLGKSLPAATGLTKIFC